jgi:hypothetical protein
MSNRYPIYIVSKGRWESRLTSRALSRMSVRHSVIVEEPEADRYRAAFDEDGGFAEVLILPPRYKDEYDVCDEFGLSKSTGPGPARNFAWDHALERGAPWHWVMDDNIDGFYRFNFNLKTPCETPAIFAAMESFVDRFENVGMAGPTYFMFAKRKFVIPAYITNTRIYSCNLIRNDMPFRWRGRYNEDTDLSLRMLKDRWCTILFHAFMQYKMPTQTTAGGNTAEFYDGEGTKPKSEMLQRLHPDVARVSFRFSRWHHSVDYSQFKDMELSLRSDVVLKPGIDNFGMVLQQKIGGKWVRIERPKSELKNAPKYVDPDAPKRVITMGDMFR